MSVTADDLKTALAKEVGYDEPDWWDEAYEQVANARNLQVGGWDATVTVIDSQTGHEGDWSVDTYIIWEVATDESCQHFRKTGSYQSYEGTSWDGPLEEVFETTKTITVWSENREYDSYGDPLDSFDSYDF